MHVILIVFLDLCIRIVEKNDTSSHSIYHVCPVVTVIRVTPEGESTDAGRETLSETLVALTFTSE